MDLSERGSAVHRHPWEVARAKFFRSLIREHALGTGPLRVLDVGAGDGWFADELVPDLAAGSEVTCWDINYSSLELESPLSAGVRRTATTPGGPFDLVLLLDVIEHVPEDAAFLDREILPLLHPDSILVISVPAYQQLFSSHDRNLSHYRRYAPHELRHLLEHRLAVVEGGNLFTTLLPLRVLTLAKEHLVGVDSARGLGAWRGGPRMSGMVSALLGADAALGRVLARHRCPPPGLSTWTVCRPLTRAPTGA